VTTADDDRRVALREAFLYEVAHGGYARAQVRAIVKRAGVSTKTFYALYADKQRCLLDALEDAAGEMQRDTERAIAKAAPRAAATAALDALVDFAGRHREAFYALTHEAPYAPAGARAIRNRSLARIHGQVEAAVDGANAGAPAPDIPAYHLLSGTIRTLGLTIRRGETREALKGDLGRWARCYEAPRSLHRWRTYTSEPALMALERQDARAPAEQLPQRARVHAKTAALRHAQRERILYATAQAAYREGYEQLTVADIISQSGVSRDVFYAHFHNKRDAFTALVIHAFEQAIGTSATAFFVSERSWPERVWDANLATARFLASNPSLAYAILSEGYRLGPGVAHADEMVLSYTVFLQDGYGYRPQAAQTPHLVGEALGGAVVEMIVQLSRDDRAQEFPGLVPLSTYIMLAPFTGTAAANELVDRKVAEHRARRAAGDGARRDR
jgi:AcrR family transcriptional regulator